MLSGFGSRELFSLQDRVAVVTGGGGGLGRAIASGLAEFGASLVIADIDEAQARLTASALLARGHYALAVSLDVSDEQQTENMVRKTLDEMGHIDILVNNAGVSRRYPIDEFPVEEWQRVIQVNLIGAFVCSRAVGKEMSRQRKGSIINIASIAGFIGRAIKNSAYSASKAGLISLTRTLAVQWAKSGVRVNAIAPAEMNSPLLDDLRREPGALEERVARIPMGRIGNPNEIIGPTVFLASEASSFVTGHVLSVDGGALAF